MANTNQGTRAGQVFGRLAGDGFAGNDWENVVLKPGYIIKIRDRFALVEAVEGLSIDLYFNDSITVSGSGANDATINTGISVCFTILPDVLPKNTSSFIELLLGPTTIKSIPNSS